MKKKKFSDFLLIMVFLVGLSLLLYPSVSDYWNSFHQSRAIASYTEQVAQLDSGEYEAAWNAAVEYNHTLEDKVINFALSEEQKEEYENLLNVADNGVIGYIDIPSIDCYLPIYHGTEDVVLQIAIGHLEWSSLPVGGEGTHTVLSGHRGLPSARLFTDLDKMVEGDIFLLQVLDETLTYEVDQIRIVEPDQLDELQIVKGEDLCTLVTCTPYGVNSHRLLVTGHRIANINDASVRVTADARQIEPIIVAPVVAAPILLLLLIWLLLRYRK